MKNSRIVWTSDPEEAKRLRETSEPARATDAPAASQTIHVRIDRKRRAGKTVTVAGGFDLTPESLTKLAGVLKKRCGAGGTAKDREIEIQGDHVELVIAELQRLGFRAR